MFMGYVEGCQSTRHAVPKQAQEDYIQHIQINQKKLSKTKILDNFMSPGQFSRGLRLALHLPWFLRLKQWNLNRQENIKAAMQAKGAWMSKGGPAYWVGNHRRSMESAGYPKTSTINLVCWGRDIPRGNSRIFLDYGYHGAQQNGKVKTQFYPCEKQSIPNKPIIIRYRLFKRPGGPCGSKMLYIWQSVCLSVCLSACLSANQSKLCQSNLFLAANSW